MIEIVYFVYCGNEKNVVGVIKTIGVHDQISMQGGFFYRTKFSFKEHKIVQVSS